MAVGAGMTPIQPTVPAASAEDDKPSKEVLKAEIETLEDLLEVNPDDKETEAILETTKELYEMFYGNKMEKGGDVEQEWCVEYLPSDSDTYKIEKGFFSKEAAQKWVNAENLKNRADEINIQPMPKKKMADGGDVQHFSAPQIGAENAVRLEEGALPKFEKGGSLPSISEVEENGEEIISYPVDEGYNSNAGDAVDYKYNGKVYCVITWNRMATEHEEGNKEISELSNDEFEKGGIVNQYTGKTTQQVWNDWTASQRFHFIVDHTSTQHTVATQEEFSKRGYNFLPASIKEKLKTHLSIGQYKNGGNVSAEKQYTLTVQFKQNAKAGIIARIEKILNVSMKDNSMFDVQPKEITITGLTKKEEQLLFPKLEKSKVVTDVQSQEMMAKGGGVESDAFKEVSDSGDEKYFIRKFGHVINKDKKIDLVAVAQIRNLTDAIPDDELPTDNHGTKIPFQLDITVVPSEKYLSKEYLKKANDEDSSISDNSIVNIVNYMGGINYQPNGEVHFKTMKAAEKYLHSKELNDRISADGIVSGMIMDMRYNRIGQTNWEYLSLLTGQSEKFADGGSFFDKAKSLAHSAADKSKELYGKGKQAVKEKIHAEKKKIALEVIDETRGKVASQKEAKILHQADNIVESEFEKGGTIKDLNDWYGRQPFDNVEKITGVDIWGASEADDIADEDTTTVSRDEALDEAKKIWDKMSLSQKQEWRDSIGDND